MTDQSRVFISYSRQDGEAFATALRRRLEQEQPEITRYGRTVHNLKAASDGGGKLPRHWTALIF
jgi:hypothetical protein